MSLTATTQQTSEEGYWNTDSLPLTKTSTSHRGEQFISSPPCIDKLPSSAYTLIRPIPICLSRNEDGEWIANFKAANISMSGDDPDEAKELLAEDIMSAFALFLAEEKRLSPRLTQDLAVLRQYMKEG